MTKTRVLLAALALVAPASSGVAQQPGAAVAPGPAPELDTLKFLVGSWRCTGKQLAAAKPHTFTASLKVRLAPDNFWQVFDYEERKSRDHAAVKLHGFWGYDQSGKRYVRSAAGNSGGWEVATSPGWDGSRLVWTGDLYLPTGKVAFRHVYTKKSDREFGHVWETGEVGKATVASDVTCKRGAADEDDGF